MPGHVFAYQDETAAETPPTLKTRVEGFWKGNSEVAARFYETIEAGKCADLTQEVSAKVDTLFPNFGWVFGPGEAKPEHSFNFAGVAGPKRDRRLHCKGQSVCCRAIHECLLDSALALGQAPLVGCRIKGFPTVRMTVHGRYLIIYKIDARQKKLLVLRFWHSARDLGKIRFSI